MTSNTSSWATAPGAVRAKYLRAIAAIVTERKSELARLESLDSGKPLEEAAWDIDDVAGCFEYNAELAEALDKNQKTPISIPMDTMNCHVLREPIGVVGLITPWKIVLYPKGCGAGKGSHISIFLALADPNSIPNATRVYAGFTFRIIDQLNAKNHSCKKAIYWFTVPYPASSGGRQTFISLTDFNASSKGFLVKDKYSYAPTETAQERTATYPASLPVASRIYAEYTLRIIDQVNAKHDLADK